MSPTAKKKPSAAKPARAAAKTAPRKTVTPAKSATTKATAKKPAHESYARARPAMQRRSATPLARLREVAFSLPEVTEKEAWGEPTFRVGEKLFAMFATDHHHDGNIAVWCKAAMGMQEILIDADPERFFKPPYVGPKGWIGIRLVGKVDWEEVRALLAESWRMTAPKKMQGLLPPASDD